MPVVTSLPRSASVAGFPGEATPLRDHKGDHPFVEDLVVRVGELDQDRVRPCGKTLDDERLAARIDPVPRSIIHGHMEVPDARRYVEGVRPEHRHDPQVLGAILDDDQSVDERIRKRRIDDNFRRGLTGERHNRSGSPNIPGSLRGDWLVRRPTCDALYRQVAFCKSAISVSPNFSVRKPTSGQDGDRKGVGSPGRQIDRQTVGRKFRAVQMISGVAEQVMEAQRFAVRNRERQMQSGLASMIREIHDGDQALRRRLLPREGDKGIVSPVATRGGAAVEELPVSFANGGMAQRGEQAGVELRQRADRSVRRVPGQGVGRCVFGGPRIALDGRNADRAQGR